MLLGEEQQVTSKPPAHSCKQQYSSIVLQAAHTIILYESTSAQQILATYHRPLQHALQIHLLWYKDTSAHPKASHPKACTSCNIPSDGGTSCCCAWFCVSSATACIVKYKPRHGRDLLRELGIISKMNMCAVHAEGIGNLFQRFFYNRIWRHVLRKQ